MLRMARHVHRETGQKNLCLAGGVALNCVGNGRILREGPFERIWIQPAAGDAGGALGAALFVWHQLLDTPADRRPRPTRSRARSSGPRSSDEAIRALPRRRGRRRTSTSPTRTRSSIAWRRLIADGQGRRLVPGAHGVRPARARRAQHPRRPAQPGDAVGDEPQDQVPRVVPALRARPCWPRGPSEWFETAPRTEPLHAARGARRCAATAALRGGRRRARGRRPAEGAARPRFRPSPTSTTRPALQTVDAERIPRFHRLLERFEAQTGCPVLINTSFNVRGEPIVCTPEDAYRCFLATDMDVLVLEGFVLLKSDQPAAAAAQRALHLSKFELD